MARFFALMVVVGGALAADKKLLITGLAALAVLSLSLLLRFIAKSNRRGPL
jgi:hypothetical protein